jgi:hypothetical protein
MTTASMLAQRRKMVLIHGTISVLFVLCPWSSAQQAQRFDLTLKPVNGKDGVVAAIEVDSVETLAPVVSH